ncbi:hypothetical protein HN51_053379 [Arachis hypogaea]
MEGSDIYRGSNSLRSTSFRLRRNKTTSSENVFSKTSSSCEEEDDEEALKWASLEKLPTYNRLRKGLLATSRGVANEIDITELGFQDRQKLLDRLIKSVLTFLHIMSSKKKQVTIFKDVSGIIKPRRMTLLLGPPSSGKTTLLLALSGKLDPSLKVSGRVSYNGHEMNEFVPQRTAAYISQHDVHIGEMTVRETLTFSARCQGVGSRYDLLSELSRREKEAKIKPDSDIDVYMKATTIGGQEASLVTDYVLKILGLDICANTMVGNEMLRGISGGQRKRVTIGEMLVGPANALFMDEISTGLDSSTTFQIVSSLKQYVHILNGTAFISLLQPTPETYELFDDIVLISDGEIIYQGPREHVLDFFHCMGFNCPERKSVADFLQEVTSKKDQEQYWSQRDQPYNFISATQFAEAFQSFHVGKGMVDELSIPFDKSMNHRAALTTKKYVLGISEISMASAKLAVLYKQRDHLFYPSWAYAIPTWILKIPLSFLDVANWVFLTYYVIGYDSNVARFFKQYLVLFLTSQMASGLFRAVAALSRNNVIVANTFGATVGVIILLLGGFILSRKNIKDWWIWGYWISPITYGLNAIMVNEFLGKSWHKFTQNSNKTLGVQALESHGFFTHAYWYWIGVGVLIGYIFLFNILYTMALTYLTPFENQRATIIEEEEGNATNDDIAQEVELPHIEGSRRVNASNNSSNGRRRKGMVLPFEPHSITFDEVVYSVDMPQEMKDQGVIEDRLVLLKGVSGAFRPGVLTALMGVTGAGKTTLMDVLAGRKTGGYIDGSIKISGYPKKQETFARISGYCEQNDIHSPHITVYESLFYSAWLRLSVKIDSNDKKMFIEEVMELVELNLLRNSLVGLPGINGLSIEQRKRLTIAVELVANPSIIFMDEPTSGLDARAAAIVMRTIRNIVDTGRTILCTIHQPNIDIFEAFDESIDGVTKIKDGHNPATWMLEATSSAKELNLGVDFHEIYKNSDLYRRNKEMIAELGNPDPDSNDLHFPNKYAQPFWVQFQACLWKQHWSYWRNPSYTAIRFFTTIILAFIFGTIFWNLGGKYSNKQDLSNAMGSIYIAVLFLGLQYASSVQPVVAIERVVFYRENAAGMYSALPYAIAQVLIELPYIFAQATTYGVMTYAMIGFEWTPRKFFWYLFFMYFAFCYYTFYGMMTVALTPNRHVASIVASSFYAIWNLFSGFIIPPPRMPVWWKWYYWACPVSWTLYGTVASQFGDITHIMESEHVSVQDFIRSYYGFKHDFVGVCAIVVFGFAMLFALIFAIAIKVLNFQRR